MWSDGGWGVGAMLCHITGVGVMVSLRCVRVSDTLRMHTDVHDN